MNLIYCVATFLLAFAANRASCSQVDGGRIYHGTTAASGQFPYVVQIFYSTSSGSYLCTGSLLSNVWVLSAAHCTDGIRSGHILIGKSSEPVNNRSEIVFDVPVSKVIPHPNYNGNARQGNDIALFKLSRPVDTTSYRNIKTIGITSETPVSTFDNYKAISVGWGKTYNDQNYNQPTLQYANVTTQVHSQCVQEAGVLSSQICTLRLPPSYSGTCAGDSGGPLVVTASNGQPMVIGANSLGRGDCERRLGTIYTYVGAFTNWIIQTANNN